MTIKPNIFSMFILGMIALTSFTGIIQSDNFKIVLNNTTDSTVKAKLEVFQKGGIEKPVDTTNYSVEGIIDYAKTFIGTPHVMGGSSKKGTDCSGLVMAVHEKFGVILPHSSHEQGRYGTIVPLVDSIQRGDLLFYYSSYNSSNFITHVGIYLGDGTFIHASASSGVIITKTTDRYWATKYLFATRLK